MDPGLSYADADDDTRFIRWVHKDHPEVKNVKLFWTFEGEFMEVWGQGSTWAEAFADAGRKACGGET